MTCKATYCVRLSFLLHFTLVLSLSGCHGSEPDVSAHFNEVYGTTVLTTDTVEWIVKLFREHVVYADAVTTSLPEPWSIPTREEAKVLRSLDFPNDERFVTCDGYTFGMPSSGVTKAGSKTKYSVLGLRKRPLVINVRF